MLLVGDKHQLVVGIGALNRQIQCCRGKVRNADEVAAVGIVMLHAGLFVLPEAAASKDPVVTHGFIFFGILNPFLGADLMLFAHFVLPEHVDIDDLAGGRFVVGIE